MERRSRQLLCSAFLLLFLPVAQAATVYKWVDAQGKTHFSDKAPPAAAQPATQAMEVGGEVERDPEMEQYRQRSRALQQAREEERAREEAEASKRAVAREQVQRRCALARDKQREVKDAEQLYGLDKHGERQFYSDQGKRDYEQDLARWIKQNCD